MTNPTPTLPRDLSRADLAILATLARTQSALRAAGSEHDLLANALASLRAQPATPPAQALAGDIEAARAVLFATPSGARKSKAAGGLVDLLARAGQPSEVNS